MKSVVILIRWPAIIRNVPRSIEKCDHIKIKRKIARFLYTFIRHCHPVIIYTVRSFRSIVRSFAAGTEIVRQQPFFFYHPFTTNLTSTNSHGCAIPVRHQASLPDGRNVIFNSYGGFQNAGYNITAQSVTKTTCKI